MSHDQPDLSVVIPAYNEAARLGPTLDKIVAYLEGRERCFEVLVVDDGSTDGTPRIAARRADRRVRVLRLDRNCGKGAALRHGVRESRGRWVLLTDADLSTPIEELRKLERHAGEADLVVGSRAVPGARITRRQRRPRELMGKAFNRILRMLALTELRDTQCGFKLIDGDTARRLFFQVTINGFAFDVQLLALARQAGARIVEVGVVWHDSPPSAVHPLTDALRMLWDVVRLRLSRRARTFNFQPGRLAKAETRAGGDRRPSERQ